MSNLRTRTKIAPLQLILGILLIISVIFGGYYFRQYQSLKTTSSKTSDQRNEELIAMINKVYELPKDETPVVAIVSDEGKFKQEYPVFTTAKKDDSLLLFEKAGIAILFRESENRVIGTATFAVKKGASVQIIATTEAQNSTEKTLTEKLPNVLRISSKSTPAGQNTATIVVDVSGNNADLVKSIASTIGGTVATTLPAAEKVADGTEVVVIVANSVAQTPAVTPTP